MSFVGHKDEIFKIIPKISPSLKNVESNTFKREFRNSDLGQRTRNWS